MSYMKRFLEDCLTVQVWLNMDAPDSFIYGWQPGHMMRFACAFAANMDDLFDTDAAWHVRLLERVFEQLNVDEPTEPWAKAYRADHAARLSVGDVVVVGEVAYACESVGWKQVSLDQQRCQR